MAATPPTLTMRCGSFWYETADANMMLFSRRVWLLARRRKSAWASSSLGPPLSSRSDSTDEPRTVSTSHAGKEDCESHEADGWGDLLRECAQACHFGRRDRAAVRFEDFHRVQSPRAGLYGSGARAGRR